MTGQGSQTHTSMFPSTMQSFKNSLNNEKRKRDLMKITLENQ